MTRPAFLVTIDNEGDNLWSRPRQIRTENARFLPRFQSLCEKYRLKPAYLTNWEMAHSGPFQELGRDVLRRGQGEIGMHLHAWNSPPLSALTVDDFTYQPYAIEYPEANIRDKVKVLTETLENTFSVKMNSHRAGRWGFNEVYARILVEHGYTVDCSVTPGVSWRCHKGNPSGDGGTDYLHYPDAAYFVDLNNISLPGTSPLLEVPMTVLHSVPRQVVGLVHRFPRVGTRLHRVLPKARWLRPDGVNGAQMLQILELALERGASYVEFMLHSSELMAGGSHRFPTSESIERLYDDMERLFSHAVGFEGMTLHEYHQRVR